jgi:general secretion pathway protein A
MIRRKPLNIHHSSLRIPHSEEVAMYLDFYGLKELPFALTPDPRFLYFTPSHTEAMANLHYGIESGKGLIVVTGEVGTGKTTILRWMMNRLDRTVLVAYLFNPRMTVSEFYQYVSSPKLLDVPRWESKSELLLKLGDVLDSRHSRGLRTVLIIDEAHGLSPSVLEEIRLMSNFESDSAKQLQIILTGQPELRDVLNQPELRQLKQRVALRCEIKQLPDIEETGRYIASRLLAAGAERTDVFTAPAVDLIFRCSEGIPRQINNLCDNSMLAGFAAGAERIGRDIVEEVAETFDLLPNAQRGRQSGEERADAARVFTPAGRSELWAASAGLSDEGQRTQAGVAGAAQASHEREVERELEGSEGDAAPDSEELGRAFRSWDDREGDS